MNKVEYYKINSELSGDKAISDIPSILLDNALDNEALVWIPNNLSRSFLNKIFPNVPILSNRLVLTDNNQTGFWLRTSIANEPPFLGLSAKEFDYIANRMNVEPFSLEIYLYVQWFARQVFRDYFDKEYWSWLPKTRFDRSGLLIGGIDKLQQFDFHGWMPDFQASFCGGRYYYCTDSSPKRISQVALNWEYDKREMSFKHWISKVNSGGEESKFAAYNLLRDFELMNLYINLFMSNHLEPKPDLIALSDKWKDRLIHQDIDRLNNLAIEQVNYYHAMLDDLVGYIVSGIKANDSFVPFRINNGLKNLRNYYLVVSRLFRGGRKELSDLHTKLINVIEKVKELAVQSKNAALIENVKFYLEPLK